MEENLGWINAKKAKRMGLKNGHYIVLVNQDSVRSNKIRAKVTERIRPDCTYLLLTFAFTSKLIKRAYLRGADDTS